MNRVYKMKHMCDQLEFYEDLDPAREFRKYKCCQRSQVTKWTWRNNSYSTGLSHSINANFCVVAECVHCGLPYSIGNAKGSTSGITHYHPGRLPFEKRPWKSDEECEEWKKEKILQSKALLIEELVLAIATR